MMEITEILKSESLDKEEILLYQEGIFYTCYEYSAYRFVHCIRAYEPKKRHYKNIDQDIIRIGFPSHTLSKLDLPQGITREMRGKVLVLTLPAGLSSFKTSDPKAEFNAWKKALPYRDTQTPHEEPKSALVIKPLFSPSMIEDGCRYLLKKIVDFDYKRATPEEKESTFQFLQQLANSIISDISKDIH